MNSIDFFYKSRQNHDFSKADPLSSGNNLFSPPSIYESLINDSFYRHSIWGDYQEAGGSTQIRQYVADAINTEYGIDYYDNGNVFISLGTTDAIDIVTLFAKEKYYSKEAYYMLPCYYLFIQSSLNYGYNINFSKDINDYYNEEFLDMLQQAPQYSLVYLNNPNSLSGVALSDKFLVDLFSIVKKKRLFCIFDEIIGRVPLTKNNYSIIDLAIVLLR